MKTLLLYLMAGCMMGIPLSAARSQQVNDQVVSALRKNDMNGVLVHFNIMVDLKIPGYSGQYSNNQAGMILKKFFKEHSVSNVNITKEGFTDDGSIYSLGDMTAGGTAYRLYLVSREINGIRKIQLFHVQDQ